MTTFLEGSSLRNIERRPGGQCQIIIFLSNTELDEKQVFDNNRSVLPPPSPITPVKWQFCGWADNNDDDTQVILLIKHKQEEDDDHEDEDVPDGQNDQQDDQNDNHDDDDDDGEVDEVSGVKARGAGCR